MHYMAMGYVKAMNSESYVGPIYLGNPNEITILEIAKIVYQELPLDDPKIRNPDIKFRTT